MVCIKYEVKCRVPPWGGAVGGRWGGLVGAVGVVDVHPELGNTGQPT